MPSVGAFFGILSAIIGVATLTVFLSSNNTAGIINALFSGFTGSLQAAMGHAVGKK